MKTTLSRDQTPAKDRIIVRVEFDPKEFEIRNGRYGFEIEFPDSVNEGRVGGPGLPAKEMRVVLPVGTRPKSVSANSHKTANLAKKGANIAPVQPLADARDVEQGLERLPAPRIRPQAAPIKTLYENEKKAPRPIARLARWELFANIPVATIVISPVTVDAENAVHIHTEFDVSVRYELASAKAKGDIKLRRPAVVRTYSNSATAAQILSHLSDVVMSRDINLPEDGQTQQGRYLIITDDWTWNAALLETVSQEPGIIDAFKRLKEWKERRGLSVILKTVTQIVEEGYGANVLDLQEAIREYIKYAHTDLGVSWVLLGGAMPIIPVRCVKNVTGNKDDVIPTDLYYSSLTVLNETPPAHDWDPNNTGSYAADATEANTAGVNFHADVSVGRVPARTAADANAWVTKLIAYEQFRNPDGSLLDRDWPNQVLLVADSWHEWTAPTRHEGPEPLPIWSWVRQSNGTVLINAQPTDPANADVLFPTTERIWARHLPDPPTTPEPDPSMINYNRNASASAPGWCYLTSDTDNTQSREPTKWIQIQGGADVLNATHYCFDHADYQDRSATDQDLLVPLLADLPNMQISKLYEDHVFMQDGRESRVPFLGWVNVLANRLSDPIPHFLSISGHGTENGLSKTFRPRVVQAVSNGNQSWIAYVFSCNTARFDLETTENDGHPSIGELSVIKPNGGAVGYVGASRGVSVEHPRYVREPFFRALGNPATTHLGLLNDARLLWLESIMEGDEPVGMWAVFSMNLLGDPEMPVWVGSPRAMMATFPKTAVWRQPFNVVVKQVTSPLSGGFITFPIANATVVLRQLNTNTGQWRTVDQGRSDQNGNAELSLMKAFLGPIEVTVSKRGFIPFLGTCRLVGSD